AVRFYSGAFASHAKLADDLRSGHRYNAACASALDVGGQGVPADRLDDTLRARLRHPALGGLQARLPAAARQPAGTSAAGRGAARHILKHWQSDADLAGVRDAAAIKKLPDEERQAWKQLWADIDALLKKQAG